MSRLNGGDLKCCTDPVTAAVRWSSLGLVLCCDVLLVRPNNKSNWTDLMCTVKLSKGFCCDLLFKCVGLVLLTERFSLFFLVQIVYYLLTYLLHGAESSLRS